MLRLHRTDSAFCSQLGASAGLMSLDDEAVYAMDVDHGMQFDNLSMADAMVAGCWPGDDGHGGTHSDRV